MRVYNSISVEDPSENFQRVRDFVDVKNCMKSEVFEPVSLRAGFSDKMMAAARNKYKINRVSYV